jgi:hypothetical protein
VAGRSIEDLTGRLKVVEERNDVDNNTGANILSVFPEMAVHELGVSSILHCLSP